MGPGRRRDPQRHEAVLAATRELLDERGYTALTFSDVAKRAGVTRQLVYRWWAVKASLVSEALFASATPEWPTTFPGPLHTNLEIFVGAIVDYACRPDVRAGIAGLMADADADTALPGLVDGLLTPLRASLTALVDTGIRRGDTRTDIDIDLTLNTIRGAVTMHLLADQTPPDVVVDHVAQLMTWALTRP
ncbi:TetR/AcrR family transcriptional regulator [Mycolicibacterium pulveris]|uniref:TetR/AcrR family transcriptional regulator n=1 Tax=Mycolicibacterium pulveris TaxID=36813 RepID=UPI003CE8FF11